MQQSIFASPVWSQYLDSPHQVLFLEFRNHLWGSSLVGQWLRLLLSHCTVHGFNLWSLVRELGSHMP